MPRCHRCGRSGGAGHAVDRSGRLFLPVEMQATFDFYAIDRNGRFGPAERKGVLPGTTPIELRLCERVAIPLRVVDDRGEPVETFGVRLHDSVDAWALAGKPIERSAHSGGVVE